MGARNYLEKVLKSTCISAKNTKISFKFYNNIALTIPFLNSLHVKKNMGMQNPIPWTFPYTLFIYKQIFSSGAQTTNRILTKLTPNKIHAR